MSARARKVAVLSALYLVQGMPYGFVTAALPLLLLERGVSAAALGFTGALFAPYWLKWLLAPLVDRYGSSRLGRRRAWLLPLQLLLAASALAGAFAAGTGRLWPLLSSVLLMNVFAAAQDVAVDGLAVDVLGPAELGGGNAAQVAGYKVGAWVVGGVLVALLGHVGGWPGVFRAMALLALGGFGVALLLREPPASAPARGGQPWALRDVLAALGRALTLPGTGWLLVFVGTYKLGESMLDVYFRPFLVKEAGFSTEAVAFWVNTVGNAVSVLGSVAGGVLATRVRPLRAVGIAAALRVVPLVGEWGLALFGASTASLAVVTCAENFFGGVLTTALFAFMMARVDRRVGASHFTLLATVELLGKMPGGPLAGALYALGWSYADLFGAGVLLSVLFLGLLVPLRRTSAAAAVSASPP